MKTVSSNRNDLNHDLEEIWKNLQSGAFKRIVFLIGSAVSCGGATPCPDVGSIRNDLILRPLAKKFENSKNTVESEICKLANDAMDAKSPLGDALSRLPFEQFMSCLEAADRVATIGTVRLAFLTPPDYRSNLNHRLVAEIAKELLKSSVIQNITVLTTNYDFGLDVELAKIFDLKPWRDSRVFVPAFKADFGGGKQLQYIKLHGCMSDEASLVFTFETLSGLIFDTVKYTELFTALGFCDPNDSTKNPKLISNGALVFALGYSFSDPDLRPVFRKYLGCPNNVIYRNVRPGEKDDDGAFRGADTLRNEFLSFIKARRYEANLFLANDNHRHLLMSIGSRLGIDVSKEDLPTFNPKPVAGMAAISAVSDRISESDAVEFLSELINVCDRSDGCGLLKEAIFDQPSVSVTPRLFYSYFRQLGHVGNYSGQIEACKELRRRFKDVNSLVTSLALISFTYTIGLPKPVHALSALLHGRYHLNQCNSYTRLLFEHHEAHFWLKMFQRLDLMISPGLISHFRYGLKPLLSRLEVKLKRLVAQGIASHRIILVGELADMHAQCLISQGRVKEAFAQAELAQLAYSAINRVHQVAQSDRTLGWCHLASNRSDAFINAIHSFARGMVRATYANDPTILPKIGANLLRVLLHFAENDDLCLEDSPKEVTIGELQLSCRHFVSIENSGEISWAHARVVRDMVMMPYAKAAKLDLAKEKLRRYSDLRVFPIFHLIV
jgi:hypothetical protein